MTRIKRGKFSELKHFYAKNSSLEHWGLFLGPLYFTSSNKVVLVLVLLSILLGYRLKRRKSRKRVFLKNRREIFRDKVIKVCTRIFNSIMTLSGIRDQYT